MRIFLIGAGQVGSTIAEALYDEHELTVVDLDATRLAGLAHRFDVATVQGNGASRKVLEEGGIREAELIIACTSRDEANIIAAMLAKKLAPRASTIVRTANPEYLEVWRERQLEVDHMVSSEEETAHAVLETVGVPAARHTDTFAGGQVQVVEFEVGPGVHANGVVGLPLREARIPPDSKVASIIRGDRALIPRGDQAIEIGDRVVVIGSPRSAREWDALMAREKRRVDDVVVWGAGRAGTAIARRLVERSIGVRLIEANRDRAREVSDQLQSVRVFHSTGFDPDFLERERVGHATAAVFAMRDDAKNLYGATLARLHGVHVTIALAHEKVSVDVFERAGIDVAINPRQLTAEEIVRHAHDPRTQQVTMLEHDRYEVLDVRVRPESELVNRPFRQLPMTGSLIGAIVRDGRAIFPHGDDVLLPGDRAIIFTESKRATTVERAL